MGGDDELGLVVESEVRDEAEEAREEDGGDELGEVAGPQPAQLVVMAKELKPEGEMRKR